jgi:hypothetical protein
MIGWMLECFKSMILSRYGEEMWEKIQLATNVDSSWRVHEYYSDDVFSSMMQSLCEHVQISEANVCNITPAVCALI